MCLADLIAPLTGSRAFISAPYSWCSWQIMGGTNQLNDRFNDTVTGRHHVALFYVVMECGNAGLCYLVRLSNTLSGLIAAYSNGLGWARLPSIASSIWSP
jgi:hypothetical protein